MNEDLLHDVLAHLVRLTVFWGGALFLWRVLPWPAALPLVCIWSVTTHLTLKRYLGPRW